MQIRIATKADAPRWITLRAQLWPDTPLDHHRDEAVAMLALSPEKGVVFLAVERSDVCGFAEATMRHDHVNGCETSPVAFLEGIYVDPNQQGTGIGRALLDAVQSWAQARGCSELGSDADIENSASHAFHRTIGFEETERVVFFRKLI